MKNRIIAFTLAETLIAITVIGVIAAITIPMLIKNYHEQITVEKVKKFHSSMNNALNLAISHEGVGIDYWDYNDENKAFSNETAQKLWDKIKPYILTIDKDCDVTRDCVETQMKYLNGRTWNSGYANSNAYKKIVLNDGSMMWLRTVSNANCKASDGGYTDVCGLMWYDINGIKKPNTLGKDIFVFVIRPYTIVPYRGNNFTCGQGNDFAGWGCAKYILEHGNMKYLK